MFLPVFLVVVVLLIAAVLIWRNLALKADRRREELESRH
jgi:sensor domain CHASE-containing protein